MFFFFCWRRRDFIEVYIFNFGHGFDFYVKLDFFLLFFKLGSLIAVFTGVMLVLILPSFLSLFCHVILHLHESHQKSRFESLDTTFFDGLFFDVVELLVVLQAFFEKDHVAFWEVLLHFMDVLQSKDLNFTVLIGLGCKLHLQKLPIVIPVFNICLHLVSRPHDVIQAKVVPDFYICIADIIENW